MVTTEKLAIVAAVLVAVAMAVSVYDFTDGDLLSLITDRHELSKEAARGMK